MTYMHTKTRICGGSRLAQMWILIVLGLAVGARAQTSNSLILSPASGAAIETTPVKLKVRFPSGDGDRPTFKVSINGEAWEGRFTRSHHSEDSALLVSRYLRTGKNKVTVRFPDGEIASTTFTLSSPPATLLGAAATGGGSFAAGYETVNTRVVTGSGGSAADYSIQVGPKLYPAEDVGTLSGFHVLALNRSDGSVVADFTTQTTNLRFAVAANIQGSACTEDFGCVVIVSSLANAGGYPSCSETSPSYCLIQDPGFFLSEMGGSIRLNVIYGQNANYSLITTVGSGGWRTSGLGNERLDCIQAGQTCQIKPGPGIIAGTGVISQGSGNIEGALVLDNMGALAFTPVERPSFTLAPSLNAGDTNTITVNGQNYAQTLSGGTGGFHLVILDRSSLTLQINVAYPTTTAGLHDLHEALHGLSTLSQDYLFFLTSMGSLAHNTNAGSSNQGTNWLKVGDDIASLGGTYDLFARLGEGDDYSLVGAIAIPAYNSFGANTATFPAAETSSIITAATVNGGKSPAPNQFIGLLKKDRQGFYMPLMYSSQSQFGQPSSAVLDEIALQAPVAWPSSPANLSCPSPSSQAGITLAYQSASYFLSAIALIANGTADIRSEYGLALSAFDPGNASSAIQDETFASLQAWDQMYGHSDLLNFTAGDFCHVQAELYAELTLLHRVHDYQTAISGTISGSQSVLSDRLTNVYQDVKATLPIPSEQSSTTADVLGGLSSALSVASYCTPEMPEVALALDAASVGISYGLSLADDEDGSPTVGYGLNTTLANLATDTAATFVDANLAQANMFTLIYTDWGRLEKLGLLLTPNQPTQLLEWTATDRGYYYSALWNAMGQQYVASFLGSLYQLYTWSDITSGSQPSNNMQEVCTIYGADNGYDTGCTMGQHFDRSAWTHVRTAYNNATPCSNCSNDGSYWTDILIAGDATITDYFNPVGLDHYQASGSYPSDSVMQELVTPAIPLTSDNSSGYNPGLQLGLYRPWLFLKTPQIPNAQLTFAHGSE